jgi:methionyl-tRNA formyltransferase
MPMLIARCRVESGDARGEPGTLDADLCISCGQGRLRLLETQPAGKKLMPWQAFANGYRPGAGDKFVRPTI